MRPSPVSTRLRYSISAALLGYCALAQSAGFALLEQSGSGLGSAFAGSGASAADATTMFFNAAGLVHVSEPQAVFVASGISIGSEFNDRASLPALAQPLGNEGGDAGGWNFVPSACASMPLGDRVGVNAPFGLKLEEDCNSSWPRDRFHRRPCLD